MRERRRPSDCWTASRSIYYWRVFRQQTSRSEIKAGYRSRVLGTLHKDVSRCSFRAFVADKPAADPRQREDKRVPVQSERFSW
jgi:hypothetical protein